MPVINPLRHIPKGPAAWYAEAVDYVNEKGLMNGYGGGVFAPGENTSRAMMATILWRMEGCPVVNYLMTFTDVDTSLWYAEAVRWAASEGIIKGHGNKTFGPDDLVTREQIAVMLYRYEQSRGGGFTGSWMFLLDFTDRDQVDDWVYEAMCWMTMNRVITGKGGGILDPKGQAARAETAVMLTRFCKDGMSAFSVQK